jgi:hypothetical protein
MTRCGYRRRKGGQRPNSTSFTGDADETNCMVLTPAPEYEDVHFTSSTTKETVIFKDSVQKLAQKG